MAERQDATLGDSTRRQSPPMPSLGGRVKMFDKNLVHALVGGQDLPCGSAELSVNLGLTNLGLTRGHGSLLLDL